MDDEDVMEMDDDGGDNQQAEAPKVYVPGVSRALKEGEQWDYDPSAYKVYHTFETGWPCLSFDILDDGVGRNEPPYDVMLVSGTQADKASNNELLVLLAREVSAVEHKSEDDSSSSSSDDEEDEDENGKKVPKGPKLYTSSIKHLGGVNRVRATRIGDAQVAAVWNDQRKVQLWNLNPFIASANAAADLKDTKKANCAAVEAKPLHTFAGAGCEGFGLGWSPLTVGRLATGDQHNNIYLWTMQEGGAWTVDQRPLKAHKGSVEDVVWSPTEAALLVSVSTDRSVRLWDTRARPTEACVCTVADAHADDVNVVAWNGPENLLATGGDDSEVRVWSLKTIQYGQPVGRLKYHTQPITSVSWAPHDSTTLLASSDDNLATLWDLAVEKDDDDGNAADGDKNDADPDVPPQLLFVHGGMTEPKELAWHPRHHGLAVVTTLSGFDMFRSINM